MYGVFAAIATAIGTFIYHFSGLPQTTGVLLLSFVAGFISFMLMMILGIITYGFQD